MVGLSSVMEKMAMKPMQHESLNGMTEHDEDYDEEC